MNDHRMDLRVKAHKLAPRDGLARRTQMILRVCGVFVACLWPTVAPDHVHSITDKPFLPFNAGHVGFKVASRSLFIIIAPPVSLWWFSAPEWPLPVGCSLWVRPLSRTGPPSLQDWRETSRSSTLGFSAQSLKKKERNDHTVREGELTLCFFF